MTPTEARIRGLARSSPWRWTILHLRVHEGFDVAQAWVDRTTATTRVEWRGGHRGRAEVVVADRDRGSSGALSPSLSTDEDGLVLTRPFHLELPEVDAMVENYQWPAMLDPVELAAGTLVSDVRCEQRRGRETWRGVFEALPDYDPRCGCCPLLWSEHSDRLENPDGWVPTATYPTAYAVALDVQTGVVVEVMPIGVDVEHTRLEVEVLDHR